MNINQSVKDVMGDAEAAAVLKEVQEHVETYSIHHQQLINMLADDIRSHMSNEFYAMAFVLVGAELAARS